MYKTRNTFSKEASKNQDALIKCVDIVAATEYFFK